MSVGRFQWKCWRGLLGVGKATLSCCRFPGAAWMFQMPDVQEAMAAGQTQRLPIYAELHKKSSGM